jgi:hypothetical protein
MQKVGILWGLHQDGNNDRVNDLDDDIGWSKSPCGMPYFGNQERCHLKSGIFTQVYSPSFAIHPCNLWIYSSNTRESISMGILAKTPPTAEITWFPDRKFIPGVLSSGSRIRRSHRVLNQGNKMAGATGWIKVLPFSEVIIQNCEI